MKKRPSMDIAETPEKDLLFTSQNFGSCRSNNSHHQYSIVIIV